MSEHLNAIQDLSHAPLAYIKEALEKSEVAVSQLNDELRAERESSAERVGEAVQMEQEIADLKDQLASTAWRASLPHEAYNKEVGSE